MKKATHAVAQTVLEITGINKRFGSVTALSGVNLRLFAGEVHALMGQNGAGKSTLIKVLTGAYSADDGEMLLQGKPIRAQSTLEAQRLGISTVYQEVNLCPNLSVAENIFSGRYPRKGWVHAWSIDWARMQREAEVLLSTLNLRIDVTKNLDTYSVAIQQMVAIARALSISAQVLILDEPTSSLDDDEVERLYVVLRKLRDEGMAILFVTHFLDQVYAICDRITVLRNGELVGEYLASELPHNALIEAMLGRQFTTAADQDAHQSSDDASGKDNVFLQASGLCRTGKLKPLDLTLHRGEVVGLGGLLGSGRTELARMLFGLDPIDAGEISLNGQRVKIDSPVKAVRSGLAMCPEDRKAEGIIAELSVRENIALALQARLGLWPFMSRAKTEALADFYIKNLGIKTESMEAAIGQLSGGNQQKAVLGRWLATAPQLLILDEPTRGIDIAAKQEIMSEILKLARKGMAVLFISSEMEEVVRLSDRIVVLRDRAKVGELPAKTPEQGVYAMIAEQA